MKIMLASRSPRRRALLKQIDIEFEIVDVEINESWDGKEDPRDYTVRVATEKARAGRKRLNDALPVLAADTAVVLDGIILGKAENRKDACSMLNRLSGKTHRVLSAVTLIDKQENSVLNVNKVTFGPLTEKEIEDYCHTDEPVGKAGAYAIQGKAAVFIKRLEGSYSGVMGLPLFETQQLLNALGTAD